MQPKLRPRRSQSSSASATTLSSWDWSQALPGQVAMRPAGTAAAPAARCRKVLRGSFILNPPATFTSFDHLVGKCEQRVRYVETHRLCGFQIEHEQEARRLLDRQVGGFSAFEDAIDQGGRTLENLAPVRSIRHQAAFTS